MYIQECLLTPYLAKKVTKKSSGNYCKHHFSHMPKVNSSNLSIRELVSLAVNKHMNYADLATNLISSTTRMPPPIKCKGVITSLWKFSYGRLLVHSYISSAYSPVTCLQSDMHIHIRNYTQVRIINYTYEDCLAAEWYIGYVKCMQNGTYNGCNT